MKKGKTDPGAQSLEQFLVIDDLDSKDYESPKLIHYGDVRDISLGGSTAMGDPGVPMGTQLPG